LQADANPPGLRLELLGSALEAIGFAPMAPDEPIREDELEIVPLLQLGLATGILDQLWSTRLGRGYAEGLRLIAGVENDVCRARFIAPVLESGTDQQTAREQAAQLSGNLNFTPVIEHALEEIGVLGRPGRVPAMCFLDLVGYTRLTEEHGDQVAAELATTLSVLVDRSSREHGGLPPVHVGVAAGPVVVQGGDYFGRTVNLGARIAAHASASQVLVSEPVVQRASPQGVTFVELGLVQLEGIAHPVRLLEARRASTGLS
jgi:adenylate cyclase